MKLSEAIKRGCKIAPNKAKMIYIDSNDSACVLGAAGLGVGLSRKALCGFGVFQRLSKKFPILKDNSFCSYIIDLNDNTKMTREQIADKLKKSGY